LATGLAISLSFKDWYLKTSRYLDQWPGFFLAGTSSYKMTTRRWLTDKTLDLPWEQEIGRRLTLMDADFLVSSADNLRKSA